MLATLRSRVLGSTRCLRHYSTNVPAIASDDLIHHVDLRVGKIVQVDSHPTADHLYVEQVALDTESTEHQRTIVSGLAKYIPRESLLNKHVIVVGNMKPSKFRGVLSQGMLLAASQGDRVELLSPPATSTLGERVQLLGQEPMGPADPVLKPKQRVFEQVAEHLRTDTTRRAMYKGHVLVTSSGPVTCESIVDGQIS
ncbi:hypothetical protein DFQ28_002879 [Apophysomyces sp. BC1034]|nr:hypothetical protein DFQ30_005496 [Apophysomyces sp. BC1015]KAG0179142.1 hypothetical protein DFQ29_002478 [Apophysomyces sp. BC1021]KAG0189804.1 hypothetical protein DFQ28_002879 [Apophysomyces sp. BC1034]